MIEIIVLIFLTRQIGAIASRKGLNPGTWKLYTVLLWFGTEIGGIIIGLGTFDRDNIVGIFLLGISCAIASYLMLRSSLLKRPDVDDEIHYIG